VSTEKFRQTVLRSLSAIGASREALFYANLFKHQDPERFALLVIDPRCLKNPLLETLIGNLKLLSDLGLTPIILIGALDDDRTSVKFQTQRLSRELEQASIRITKLNMASYGLIPEVRAKTKKGLIPILEMTSEIRALSLSSLVKDVNPNKVIFLQPSGGLLKNDHRLSTLTTDKISSLIASEINLTVGQKRFLSFVSDLDAESSHRRTYIIASPLNLLSELFTTKGSGTLIKRRADIIQIEGDASFDVLRLKNSIGAAFGKPLSHNFSTQNNTMLYLERYYRGGAIFDHKGDYLYLSKFWVSKEAQGEGLAKDIWDAFSKDYKSFFWRSRLDNPFNQWYMKRCDGMQIQDDWRVFWKGFDSHQIGHAIELAIQSKVDFKEEMK